MFFIGGVVVFVVIFVIYFIILVGKLNYFNVFLVGFIEEIGKMIIVVFFICLLNLKYILNGLFIGVVVGVGFVVFELFGYVFNYSVDVVFLFKDIYIVGEMMFNVIFSCGWQFIGGYVVWVVIIGVVFVIVKGD